MSPAKTKFFLRLLYPLSVLSMYLAGISSLVKTSLFYTLPLLANISAIKNVSPTKQNNQELKRKEGKHAQP